MSDKFKSTGRCYLIDHHSPDHPCITLDKIDFEQYKRFFAQAQVDSIMLYCKDHWGNSYYSSSVEGAYAHPALKGLDFVGGVKRVTDELGIELVAYYCFEYDTGAASRHPEWQVVDPQGKGVIRDDQYAKWKLCCMNTGYGEYCLSQLEEILRLYSPDAFFLDIFGASLCYCPNCRKKYNERFGYPMPEGEGIAAHSADVQVFLDDNSFDLLTEVQRRLKAIDPTIAVTINFASHYPQRIRALLDYQFAEPVLQDNWFSSAYTRATAKGRYPIMMPGEFSAVYNYPPDSRYIADLSEIAAQGCRVGMYSGSQHVDGTLEHTEAQKVGGAFGEIAKLQALLGGSEFVGNIAILQSDASLKIGVEGGFPQDSILRLKRQEPHVKAVLGAMKLCESAKVPYCVLPEQEIADLSGYIMVILPELYIVSDQTKAALEAYVKGGGVVLCGMQSGLYGEDLVRLEDFALSELLGVKLEGMEERYAQNTWAGYLSGEGLGGIFEQTTPPVSGRYAKVVAVSAKALATFIPPCVKCDDENWVNWWSPPPACDASTEHGAALTKNAYGEGRAYYAAFDLFTMAAQDAYECAKDVFAHVLSDCAPPEIRHITPCGDIIRTAFSKRETQDGTEYLVHMVSQLPKKFGGQVAPIDAGSIEIRLPGEKQATAIEQYPDYQTLQVKPTNGTCNVSAGTLQLQKLIAIKVSAAKAD